MSDVASTSRCLRDLGLRRATLLVDRRRAEANLARFAARAQAAGVVLRPHFKTHQSAAVAAWFRHAGATCATVSSVGMARYFADHGWRDLLLAIPINPLEIAAYEELAGRIALGLTIASTAGLDAVIGGLRQPAALWIEVDTGHGRSGIGWDDHESLVALAGRAHDAAASGSPHRLAGLLTHGGQSYAARDRAQAAAAFAVVRERLQAAGRVLREAGLPQPLLSAGDTPGFAACADWSGLDEARPGNYVYHDLMQLAIGVCSPSDLACAVACPVIGLYPERGEAVLHAGAVHLARESLREAGADIYGRLLGCDRDGFGGLLSGWRVTGLAQEHGRLAAGDQRARAELGALRPGDLVLVAPVHACLTCEQFGSYLTLDGEVLPRYRRD